MQGLQSRLLLTGKILSFSSFEPSFPTPTRSLLNKSNSCCLGYIQVSKIKLFCGNVRAQASDVGAGSYEGGEGKRNQNFFAQDSIGETPPANVEPPIRLPYPVSIAGVILGCALAFSLAAFLKGGPSPILVAIAKSGFTAAFALIFVSEIGDKTFFIAALLAMQYGKGLVLIGSMGALALMTILSVAIGRIFHSVPAQFRTTVPIGEYAAIALLMFFGIKSIKNAWDLPSNPVTSQKENQLGELAEAEELVKEKVAKRLTSPLEVIWKSFGLVFFAEWGDRSMLATIALGASQSPLGVASGAIAGHLAATSVAVLGGSFLSNYISEKLVGYLGGVLFLIFAVATLLGVF